MMVVVGVFVFQLFFELERFEYASHTKEFILC